MEKLKSLFIRISPALHAAIKKEAAKEGFSINLFLTRLLNKRFKK